MPLIVLKRTDWNRTVSGSHKALSTCQLCLAIQARERWAEPALSSRTHSFRLPQTTALLTAAPQAKADP